MSKVRLTDNGTIAAFMCPGCKCSHGVRVKSDGTPGPVWGWNGSIEKPTFNPSILVRWNTPKGERRCHSFVRDGKIQFLSDCTHALAGQTVELPELDAEEA